MERVFTKLLAGVALLAMTATLALAQAANGQEPAPISFQDCSDCPKMVVVPPGSFLMGSTSDETERDTAAVPVKTSVFNFLGIIENDHDNAAKWMSANEHPQHQVTIRKSFALGFSQVTQREFSAFVRETGYVTGSCWMWHVGRPIPPVRNAWSNPNFTPSDNSPVVCITWSDANAYVHWLNRKLGQGGPDGSGGPYRLPSEAEWEYAARAGTRTAYWWGDEIGVDHALCDGCNRAFHWTVAVGEFPSNPFGLTDMNGNAVQWMEDCWNNTYAGAPIDGEAWLSGDCSRRVVRGGAWHNLPWVSRSATRIPEKAASTWNSVGFRVAKDM
jgi:formylglycine-generating enzyme required for sulfatase activity